MRQFYRLLFMGAGEYTEESKKTLHKELDEAFSISSGMQQCVLQGSEEEKVWEQKKEDIVRDIAMALLGRKIEFGERVPYPEGELEGN